MPDNPKIPEVGDGEQENHRLAGGIVITSTSTEVEVLCGKPGVHKNQRFEWAEYDSAINDTRTHYGHQLYKNQITLEGHNFSSVRTVLLSTVDGEGYPTGDPVWDLPTIDYGPTTPSLGYKATDKTSFTWHNGGATISPALLTWQLSETAKTNVEHNVGTYRLIDDNHISVSLPVFTELCYVNVIIMNPISLDSIQLDVTTKNHPNQLYVRYWS